MMLSFPNPSVTKAKFVAIMEQHAAADRLTKGSYSLDTGDDFRGCAIGCGVETINRLSGRRYEHSNRHALADMLGIPISLVFLEERIFENLPPALARQWPVRFARSIPEGADVSPAVVQILVRVLREIALPAVTVDEWGVRDAVEGVCLALETGVGVQTAAYIAGLTARLSAAHARSTARNPVDALAASAARAAACAATSDGHWICAAVANAVAACAVAVSGSGPSASDVAYEKIADIIFEEMAACGPKNLAYA